MPLAGACAISEPQFINKVLSGDSPFQNEPEVGHLGHDGGKPETADPDTVGCRTDPSADKVPAQKCADGRGSGRFYAVSSAKI